MKKLELQIKVYDSMLLTAQLLLNNTTFVVFPFGIGVEN